MTDSQKLQSALKKLPWVAVGLALALGLALGFASGWSSRTLPETPKDGVTADAKPTTWTCSMHPQIQSPEPGLCPVCGMELIPVTQGSASGPRVLALSPAAAALAEIETAPVERRAVTHEVRLIGKVDFDETRLSTITAWIPGRLDRLYVDYTGTLVRTGDHLVDIYSPQLLSAQEELLQALDARRKLQASKLLRESADRTVDSAREKLRLWGIGPDQIQEIERTRKVSDHITVRAPIGGVVVQKNKSMGDYVKTGERIYTIADLSQVWVKLDAYESDLSRLRYGQRVTFETEAYPGESFEGRVVFVDPVLEEKTRTVKLRLNVTNTDGRLRPGMFVRATVRAHIGEGGASMDAELTGKWICPMHGEIIKDDPGACDLCGMALVAAESLHQVGQPETEPPLVVPATAVLWTGKRSVVYVRLPGDEPTFEGREVALGPRSGDYYVVRAGLKERERVVTQGSFKIDSALQIQARPSMMLPPPAAPKRMDVSPKALTALSASFGAYLELQRALAADDAAKTKAAAEALERALGSVDLTLFEKRSAKRLWVAVAARARAAAKTASAAGSLEEARRAFADISREVLAAQRRLGHAGPGKQFEIFCPMAFDSAGASWLQDREEVANPYFGASMLRCGEVRETFAPVEHAETPKPAEEPKPAEKPKPAERTETPKTSEDPKTAAHPVAHQLTAVWVAYLKLQQALGSDDAQGAQSGAKALSAAAGAVRPTDAESPSWKELGSTLREATSRVATLTDLGTQRVVFEAISKSLAAAFERFGHVPSRTVRRFHCPMAFKRGADWLQEDERTLNPYFGKRMLRCGRQTAVLPPGGKQ